MNHLVVTLLAGALLWNSFSNSKTAQEITTMKEYEKISKQDKPVMFFFYAPWCGACKRMKAPYDKVASENNDITMVKISIENKELKPVVRASNIEDIPTLITLKAGTEVSRKVGRMDEDKLRALVNEQAPKQSKAAA